MKDVSEILAKRLQRLEQPFSREWIADFSNLMEFILGIFMCWMNKAKRTLYQIQNVLPLSLNCLSCMQQAIIPCLNWQKKPKKSVSALRKGIKLRGLRSILFLKTHSIAE